MPVPAADASIKSGYVTESPTVHKETTKHLLAAVSVKVRWLCTAVHIKPSSAKDLAFL